MTTMTTTICYGTASECPHRCYRVAASICDYDRGRAGGVAEGRETSGCERPAGDFPTWTVHAVRRWRRRNCSESHGRGCSTDAAPSIGSGRVD